MPSLLNSIAIIPQRVEDMFTGRGFEEKADQIINAAHSGSSRDQVEGRLVMQHSNCFAPKIRKLTAQRDEQVGLRARTHAEIASIEKKIHNGSIPQFAQAFSLPKSFWAKLCFFLLLAIGLGLAVIEGLNLAWFLRFKTDSLFFGILCTIPIFAFPAVEAVIVHNGLILPRVRNIIMLAQGGLAIAALAGYLYYSLIYADSSLVTAFADVPQGFSTEQLRMAFQVLTSVLFSGVCLLGAETLGERIPAETREYRKATEKIETLRLQTDRHAKSAESFSGRLERIEARKHSKILRWHQRFDELKAAESAHTATINKILSQ